MHEIDSEIKDLARTVLSLMREFPGGWVTWRRVSRQLKGTDEFADLLAGEAGLRRDLFHIFRDKVKLTAAGIEFARMPEEDQSSSGALLAKAVRQYASTLEDLRFSVVGVSHVRRSGKRYIHAVEIEQTDSLVPSETPVKLVRANGTTATHGRVVGQEPEGETIYIAFDNEVLEYDLPAVLLVDRGFLLYQLSNRLDILGDLPKIVAPLFAPIDQATPLIASDESRDVAGQLSRLPFPWLRFLWGPPGAGKTYALALFAAIVLERDPEARVLLVAPSNRAVDVATLQVVARLEEQNLSDLMATRRVTRFGYPRLPSVLARAEILGPENLDELTTHVRELADALSKAEREQEKEPEIAGLRTDLLAAQEDLKSAVGEHVQKSRLVATTTALSYLESSPVWQTPWDVVLVDEATMVPPASLRLVTRAWCSQVIPASLDQSLRTGIGQHLTPAGGWVRTSSS